MGNINIVAYGDSNTYGFAPNGSRYEKRYTTILNELLGNHYKVYEEGLVGRTTIYDDKRNGRKGIDSVLVDLSKYQIIDLLIIMLGTNDYKKNNAKNLYDIRIGLNKFLNKIKTLNIKKVLLVSPITLSENINILDDEFDYNSYLLSKFASEVYKEIAKENNFLFFDAKEVAFAGYDGEHLTSESHINLGNALFKIIKEKEV